MHFHSSNNASFPFSLPASRYRLDDINTDRFSDSDSLSFNSLSRSSSLIQFESLERQLQGENQSFGGSTPSINCSLDNANTTNEQHQQQNDNTKNAVRCYYDIDKLDFNNSLFISSHQAPDSEPSSSDNSIFSDGRDPYGRTINNLTKTANTNENEEINRKNMENNKNLVRCKNSTENLSEDSGYCEFSSIKSRSKSNPNLKQNNYHIEMDDSSENHKSLNNLYNCQRNVENDNKNISHSTNSNMHLKNSQNDTKIDSTKPHPSAHYPSVIDNINRNSGFKLNGDDTTATNISSTISEKSTVTSASSSVASSATTTTSSSTPVVQLQNIISASLPDILNHFNIFGEPNYCDLKNSSSSAIDGGVSQGSFYEKDDFCIVSSVPNNLNFYSSKSINSDECSGDEESLKEREHNYQDDLGFSWNLNYNGNSINNRQQRTTASVANKNFDLGAYVIPTEVKNSRQQKIINSSYSNLTILDYSVGSISARSSINGSLKNMANKSNRSSTSSREFGKGNFLLDEISAHFDRNLSILNDKDENCDLFDMVVENKEIPVRPPQPPPRRQSLQKQSNSEQIDQLIVKDDDIGGASPSTASPTPSDSSIDDADGKQQYTFDRDPTNLKTCYADSLEQCNFDLNSSTTSVNTDKQLPFDDSFPVASGSTQSSGGRREFVSSTPNLYSDKNEASNEDVEEFRQISSTHTSLNPIPQSQTGEKAKGILSAGSRNSLGKGVSFYPYVSEISWRENSMDESVDYSETDAR